MFVFKNRVISIIHAGESKHEYQAFIKMITKHYKNDFRNDLFLSK